MVVLVAKHSLAGLKLFRGVMKHSNKNHSKSVFLAALVFFLLTSASPVYGQDFFAQYACDLQLDVLGGSFGAMLTAIAGVIAIIAAAAGSFKGAWACVFVSVGSYVLPEIIGILSPTLNCGG